MEAKQPIIGIVGGFQIGKSTLVNCLLDDKVAATGDGRATTHIKTVFSYGEVQSAYGVNRVVNTNHVIPFYDYISGENFPDIELSHLEINLWKPLLQHIQLVDTPGFDACDEDNKVAFESLKGLDFIIVVVRNKDLNRMEKDMFRMIKASNLPFAVLVNCLEIAKGLWNPMSKANQRICQNIEGTLKAIGCIPHPINGRYIWAVNLAWFWYATQHMQSYDLSEVEEDLYDDVKRFMYKKLELTSYSYVDLAGRSNFIPFRQTIHRIATHYSHYNNDSGVKALGFIKESQNQLNTNLDLAMIAAERACYVANEFKPALYNRAWVCFRREEYEETIHSAKHVLTIDSRDVDTLFLLAKTYFTRKDYIKTKQHLAMITDLLESEWNVNWKHSDKVTKASKYVEAYLMKMECEQRCGHVKEALEALRVICFCKEQPLDNLSSKTQLLVWALSASLEYNSSNFSRSINAATISLMVFEKEEFDNNQLEDLKQLCELFELSETTIPLSGRKYYLRNELQRILWKASYEVNNYNIDKSVKVFNDKTEPPVSESIWIDEPKFIPYYISSSGQKYDDLNIDTYVEAYFKSVEDDNVANFSIIARKGLKGECLTRLQEALTLKCTIDINLALMMNSVMITNRGLTNISHITVTLEYSEDGIKRTKTLQSEVLLKKNATYKWKNVIEGKKAFGNLFGSQKIANAKVTSVIAKQGSVNH